MLAVVHDFVRDERGQGTLEYGLVLGLIAMIVVGALLMAGSDTSVSLNRSATALERSAPFSARSQ